MHFFLYHWPYYNGHLVCPAQSLIPPLLRCFLLAGFTAAKRPYPFLVAKFGPRRRRNPSPERLAAACGG